MVFESVFGALNPIFDPIVSTMGPILSILIIACIVAFITTIATKLLVNQDRLSYLQKEMKGFNQEMMQARKSNDPEALEKAQKKQMDFMGLQKEMMFMSFKPMLVTYVPIIIIYYWMWQSQLLNHVIINLPSFAYYVLLVPIWHAIPYWLLQPAPGSPLMSITWLGWYFLCSFGLSQLFRKFMGVKNAGSI